ncbi:unnamed protein product [Cylindrotheca closterium]|uniref:Endonuclease/exonuclease/phosphatase domain-containing protein n=1 Tax=Cylindrotheca closterium TaxID=2856 RepID=A0AAD2CSP2_9STRA|nr:unnamed protein product [Cylindrotheca closterium]
MKHHDFTVTTYNMLARSLGTNTIPWVMDVSPSIQRRIEQASSYDTFSKWVDNVLMPEYLQHFHKNFASGNYAAMRKFWGVPNCQSANDIPKELKGLKWIDEDRVSYTKSENSKETQHIATTMRGTCRKALPNDLFDSFFNEVISKEEGVYSWDTRGPRIFQTLLLSEPPGIIAIQEYDCHDVQAEYRKPGCVESFSEAMSAVGYSGVFLKDPLLGRGPPSGLGVFWMDSEFETLAGKTGIESLDCGEFAFDDSVSNIDLEEHWHPIKPDNSDFVMMKAADRRNGALCRLRHKRSGRKVALCTAHLMTKSRDGLKTNKFPGEVRACELAALKRLVESTTQDDEIVVLAGDFNTDAKEALGVFAGKFKSSDSEEGCEFQTGFDVKSKTFRWGPHVLQDAFAETHQWGDGVGAETHCTSRNANRIEWIDYIFHDGVQLETLELSKCVTPPALIPDEQNPSDHLPLNAKFRLL